MSTANITFAQDITLAWDANQESDVAFYNIYFRDVETQDTWQEPGPAHDPLASTVSHQVLGLDGTRQHCFSVTALNDSGLESSPSGEICTTVETPAFVLTYPNGGESQASLTTMNIQWAEVLGAATYWVRFSSDGGTTWSRLATQDAALGTNFSWSIPNNINSVNCLINVIAFNDASKWLTADSSDAVFSITPAVTVFTPNGGGLLTGLTTTKIQWTAHPDAASYWVRFSNDGGATWSRLAIQNATLGTNYSWSIPNNINSVNCLINVIAFNGAGKWLAADSSDAVFSITQAVTVFTPNGRELLTGLTITNIQWTAHPDAASYWVRFSSDGGTTWSRLTTQTATSGTNYSWSIPNNIDSTFCLINVIAFDAAGTWLTAETSDSMFTVTPAP